MLLRGCGSAGLGTALVPAPCCWLGRWHSISGSSRVRETSLWWPARCSPLELTGGLGSPCPASVPWGSPLQRGISAARHALVMAGEGREETPELLSSQSCAHFTAGSGQCQHLWRCHRPGMPLSHPGRSRRGGGWADYLILEPVPASRGLLSWALQGQCARHCPAVVTSRSCSGARPTQGLWIAQGVPSPAPGSVWFLGVRRFLGELLSPQL